MLREEIINVLSQTQQCCRNKISFKIVRKCGMYTGIHFLCNVLLPLKIVVNNRICNINLSAIYE